MSSHRAHLNTSSVWLRDQPELFRQLAEEPPRELVDESSTLPEVFLIFQAVDYALWPAGRALCARGTDLAHELQLQVPPDHYHQFLAAVRYTGNQEWSVAFRSSQLTQDEQLLASFPMQAAPYSLRHTGTNSRWFASGNASTDTQEMTSKPGESSPQWACAFFNEPGSRELSVELTIGSSREPLTYNRRIIAAKGAKLALPGYVKPDYARRAEGARRLAAAVCGPAQSEVTPDSPDVMTGGVTYGELNPSSRTLLDQAADMQLDADSKSPRESKTPRNTGAVI